MSNKDLLKHEDPIIKEKYKSNGKVVYKNTCSYCGNIVEYEHGKKPEKCPHCNKESYIKPFTETRLFRLQQKYIETKNKEILGNMFIILKSYSSSLIKKLLPRTFTYHYEKVEEKASDATNLIMRYYLTNDNFSIEQSFAGYLNTKIREVLWNKKDQDEDNHLSIHSYVSEEIDKEIIDTTNLLGLESLYDETFEKYLEEQSGKHNLLEGLKKIIELISQRIFEEYGRNYQLIILMGISHYIDNQGKMKNFYEMYSDDEIQDLVDRAMILIYEYIKEH